MKKIGSYRPRISEYLFGEAMIMYCTKAKIDRRVGAEAEARIGCKFW